MPLTLYAQQPHFPFQQYFNDWSQYRAAQRYWIELISRCDGYVPLNWCSLVNHACVSIDDARYQGRVVWLRNSVLKKEICICHQSLAGLSNMIFVENQDMLDISDAETLEIVATEGFDSLIHSNTKDMTPAEAEQSARDSYRPFNAWVENTHYPKEWNEPDLERLYITAEISSTNDAMAIEIINLFLAEEIAEHAVHARFPPID